ncbi:hypothetical protein PGT21_023320 [Puccinia graminis f. sp. tritici]|uniref:Uncharacterized protein n=1 Tax=Puccinia graminis f. sp. tritici TaxID=56615 RepID=A0A5B0LY68_PUCGR|nr:hypothetical protein PGT21_023320 [Puccinia graminis f. sp. tritici]
MFMASWSDPGRLQFMASHSNPGRLHHPPTRRSIHPSKPAQLPPKTKNLPIIQSQKPPTITKMELDYLQEPSKTQESTLGPSQQTPYHGLFFEGTQPPETQIQPLEALSPPDPDDEAYKSPRTV